MIPHAEDGCGLPPKTMHPVTGDESGLLGEDRRGRIDRGQLKGQA